MLDAQPLSPNQYGPRLEYEAEAKLCLNMKHALWIVMTLRLRIVVLRCKMCANKIVVDTYSSGTSGAITVYPRYACKHNAIRALVILLMGMGQLTRKPRNSQGFRAQSFPTSPLYLEDCQCTDSPTHAAAKICFNRSKDQLLSSNAVRHSTPVGIANRVICWQFSVIAIDDFHSKSVVLKYNHSPKAQSNAVAIDEL